MYGSCLKSVADDSLVDTEEYCTVLGELGHEAAGALVTAKSRKMTQWCYQFYLC